MIFSPLYQWIELIKNIKQSRCKAKYRKAISSATSLDIEGRNLASIKISAGTIVYFIDINTTRDEIEYLSITEITNLGGKNQEKNRIKVYSEHIQEFKEAIDFAIRKAGIGNIGEPINDKKTATFEKAYKKWTSDDEIMFEKELLPSGKIYQRIISSFSKKTRGNS